MKNNIRDLVGYGKKTPKVNWPKNAKLALQFVLNYEEGAESCVLNGDKYSEVLNSELINLTPIKARHMNMESIYEYGSRRGFWRIYDLFKKNKIPFTVYAVANALTKNPDVCSALMDKSIEVACHGLKWIDYQHVPKQLEKKHMYQAIQILKKIFRERPLGWYTGRCSPNTLDLVMDEGGFLYSSDSYADDLPYWHFKNKRKILMVPYTFDNNDGKFVTEEGFINSSDFFYYLKDSFDYLYKEGKDFPKMMSVGLHCRIIGRPGRIVGLEKFIKYVKKFKDIWICKRIDIANHWIKNYS
jgi:allantoinase